MMAYATPQDLETRFGADELLKLADRDGDGLADAGVIERALADAEAEINGYLTARYRLPLATVPLLLTRLACDLARYALAEDHTPEPVAKRAEEARQLLKRLADGTVNLGLDAAAQPTPPAGGVAVTTGGRVFTRETLEDS